MGYYINAVEGKEAFLQKHGVRYEGIPSNHREGGNVVVCLVDNGAFTAAAIAYDPRELEAFKYADGRRRQWWLLPIEIAERFMQGEKVK